MMRYCKIDISRPFLQRLKFWFCGGVSVVSADFEMSLVHAQGRDSHGLPVHQQNAAISSNLANLGRFDHLSQPSYRTAIALMLGLRRHADAQRPNHSFKKCGFFTGLPRNGRYYERLKKPAAIFGYKMRLCSFGSVARNL
ncbi:MAG TPA: hypothetical protein DEB58_00955 [Alphaproteobacteria bacterium]|nr:hypothetical protein [Alphaproteobacteria bacterium]